MQLIFSFILMHLKFFLCATISSLFLTENNTSTKKQKKCNFNRQFVTAAARQQKQLVAYEMKWELNCTAATLALVLRYRIYEWMEWGDGLVGCLDDWLACALRNMWTVVCGAVWEANPNTTAIKSCIKGNRTRALFVCSRVLL